MDVEVKKIQTEETYALRIEILRNGVASNYQFEADKEANSLHFGAFYNKKCIGIVSFMRKSPPKQTLSKAYQLRGMAVALAYQKKGIGNQLIYTALPILKELQAALIWCNAREVALGFYQKNNFQIIGDAFEIANIGKHYVMIKQLNIT